MIASTPFPGVDSSLAATFSRSGCIVLCAAMLLVAFAGTAAGRVPPSPVCAESPGGDGATPEPAIQRLIPHQDLYGDEIPDNAVLRLGTTRLRNSWRCDCVAFSPDGRWIASGGRAVRIFDATTGRMVTELTRLDRAKSVCTVAFSPDGRHVATADRDGSIRIFSIADGKEVFLKGHPGRGSCVVAFLPDGRTLVSFGGNGDARLWDIATGKELSVFEHGFGRRGHEVRLAISPDGKLVAGSVDNGIRIWAVATGVPQAYIARAHDAYVTSLAFTQNGKMLVSCGIRNVVIGADDPETRHALFLSQIRTWDVQTGKMQGELLTDEPGRLLGVAAPLQGDALVAATEQAVLVFDPSSGEQMRSLAVPNIAQSGFGEMAVSPDGRTLAAATGESAVHLIDLETGQLCVPLVESHTDLVRAVEWSAEGEYVVTGSSDGTVRLWDAETSQPLRGLEFSERCMNLFAVAISPDGRFVAAAGDFNAGGLPGQVGLVRVWHAHTGRLLHQFQDERGAYFNLAFSSDGKLLAAAPFAEDFGLERGLQNRGGAIDIFRTDNGEKLVSLAGHDRTSTALSFTLGDERLISVGQDRAIRMWKLPGGESAAVLEVATGQTAAISPGGRSVVTGSGLADNALTIRSLPSGEVVHKMRGDSGFGAHALDVSSDGKLLVSGCQSDVVTVWDIRTGEKLMDIRSPQADVFAVAFDPSGTRIVTGLDDGTAVVWDISRARQIDAGQE
jgi:WD40 repeat protein